MVRLERHIHLERLPRCTGAKMRVGTLARASLVLSCGVLLSFEFA